MSFPIPLFFEVDLVELTVDEERRYEASHTRSALLEKDNKKLNDSCTKLLRIS